MAVSLTDATGQPQVRQLARIHANGKPVGQHLATDQRSLA